MEDFEEDEFAEGPDYSSADNDGSQPSQNEPPSSLEPPQEGSQEDDADFTEEVLKIKGIDPDAVKFQDESGAIVERPWDTLSRAEQINILTDSGDGSEHLDEDEIALLNHIRTSGMGVGEYLQSLMPQPEPKTYKIDDLSDEDVYVLNLLDTVGSDNITDEELSEQLDVAKLNEGLFLKQVEGLRQKYQQLQEDEEAQQVSQIAYAQQEQYNNFANAIQSEIGNLREFAGRPLELSNDDMEDLAQFTLGLDESGMSAFGHAMQDPAIFTRAAFWVLNEDAIMNELKKLILDNYTRGYNAGKADKGSSKLVFQKPRTQQKRNGINDIDFDEFD